jgi:predicted Ser/Thr protein kinase
MECLDANAVQDLMSGALDHSARVVAVEHLDGCEDCRALVSLLAKDVTRTAALETLRGSDPALRVTDPSNAVDPAAAAEPKKIKLSELEEIDPSTVLSRPDPLGRTAEASLIMKSGMRQLGKTFGRYTLVERIGAGAMGVVYKADDPGLGRRVALKLLHKPDAALTDRLIREARSMAQVNHPHVVQVYDAGVSEGSTYIAMELVTGKSLRAWQQDRHTIPEILEMYVAAGRGLAAAHAAGIVHRDFKPDNVLVGGDGRVRVTDFGLASARPSEDSDIPVGELELTHSGMVLGTPAYMAPEQFTGGNVDPRTDQFNYCVALYEALYGQRPFPGKSFDELGDNVCDGKIRPAPPGTRVSRELRAIVLRGLAVRPGDRYPTMDALLDELGRDRTRRWRMASIGSAILACALGLALGADYVVRDRVSHENNQSFAATGVQIDRAFQLLAGRFDANANQMYHQAAIRAVTSHRDQFDFGLGSEEDDEANRQLIRQQLESQDWDLWRKVTGRTYPLIIGVADYKGRLFYTNAPGAGEYFLADLATIRWLKQALDAGQEKTMILQPVSDDALRASMLLGKDPGFTLAFFFARTLFLGSGATKEQSGTIVQALDASQLIEDIRLDKDMQLAIVASDGITSDASDRVPQELIEAALGSEGRVIEVHHAGQPYQVKSAVLTGLDGARIGNVVMARELGGVLSGFFPGARPVFATTALLALVLVFATGIQVRRLSR